MLSPAQDQARGVQDAVLPGNAGGYRLTVEDGMGRVDRIDSTRVTVTCNGLAALYTGWWSARRTRSAGLLTGATDVELDTFDALFGGSLPWLNEFF